MNTFVPVPSYSGSARYLSRDKKRLNKQVSECGQMLRQVDQFPHGAWCHHPAVRMWVGCFEGLFQYMLACEQERLRLRMNPHREVSKVLQQFPELWNLDNEFVLPEWWNGPIHASHQRVLEAKWNGVSHEDYKHLYFWPV